ncbi:coat protein [ssRNA phage Zoerhiza.2_27]|uniref:Coat protein n=2 Tax=Leviviricetes TaxID=2842243 RepID=A0A8S5KXY5_9VIRU|nr:coat protein [ssRNA phage Zoerhiza.2_27]QDH90441.1 MAG: hypothetical protein H2Rhizo33695_000002 [Leviviridae sp.]DAD49967.1 TPA_asm: coat protein [ssRNA phage Zoerhiza.2_27]
MAYTLTDPISITIDGVAHSLKRVNQDAYGSEYLDRSTSALYEVRMKIRHTKEASKIGQIRMDRHNVELTKTVYGSGINPDVVTQAYIVIRNGYNAPTADTQKLSSGLVAALTADNLTGVINWQN